MRQLFFIITISLLFSACFSTLEDNYQAFHGKARITSIKTSQYNPNGNHDFLDIFFTFTPDNLDARNRYKYKDQQWSDNNRRLFINSRGNLSKRWAKSVKIKVNNVYSAIRYEKRGFSGGVPVFFKVNVTEKE